MRYLILLSFSFLLACGGGSNPAGPEQRPVVEQLWGWWLTEWQISSGHDRALIYSFLQDGIVYYNQYTDERKDHISHAESGEYKYDSLTGYISILWGDETEWERPFDRYFGGDSLKRADRIYVKQSAPPDWAK